MTTINDQQYGYSKAAIRRSFNRAVKRYDSAALLQNVVGERLMQRLDWVKLDPRLIVDLGSATGVYTRQLQQRYKKAKVIGVDLAERMSDFANQQRKWLSKERFICADAEFLPFADNSVQLIFSNLMLHWIVDPDPVFREAHRVLAPGGLLMFTSFGPDTLKEMRKSWALVDDRVHVNRFLDMHDVGDSLTSCRFNGAVMDNEVITMNYDTVADLHADLRSLGEVNINRGRRSGLTSPVLWKRYIQAYQSFRTAEGVFPASWEIVYGHAWASEDSTSPESGDGGYADIIKMSRL